MLRNKTQFAPTVSLLLQDCLQSIIIFTADFNIHETSTYTAPMNPAAKVYMNDLKNSRNTNTANITDGSSLKTSPDRIIHSVVVKASGMTKGISVRRTEFCPAMKRSNMKMGTHYPKMLEFYCILVKISGLLFKCYL